MNNSSPILFSIIVPTYNRAALIIESLKSAVTQTYTNYEIIVVDDGSTDNTEEVIKNFNHPQITYYKKKNEERAVARNTGAKLAKGDYVTFFDSDDFLYSNHLSEAIKMIEKYNHPAFFYLAYDVVDINKKVISKQQNYTGSLNKKLIKGNYLSCNGVFLKREIALQHPFNTDRALSASEDYELWLRLASRYTLYYTNTITSSILHHDERSVLVVKIDSLIERINLLIKYCTNDLLINKINGQKINTFVSKSYLYLALHLAIANYKKEALKYFFNGLKKQPLSFFDRRTYGIIKCLIINQK